MNKLFRFWKISKQKLDPIHVLQRELSAKGQNMTESEVEQYVVDIMNNSSSYKFTLGDLHKYLQKIRQQRGVVQ